MSRPIVVGVHPKRHEPEPVELAVMLARLTGAPLHMVGTFWFDATPRRNASREYEQEMRDEVRAAFERSLGDRGAPGEVQVHAGFGAAAQTLHETADELDAGLIVTGSTHRGPFNRITLGSTTDRVLDRPPCPVAVAPRGFRDPGEAPRHVGVAFVDTPGGWAALRAGAALARLASARLSAYTVIEPHIFETERERAEEAVERALAEHARDLDARPRLLTSAGLEALAAESRGLDALVRGTRSRAPLRRPLAFGLPGRLARVVECPFVVVPPAAEHRLVELLSVPDRAHAVH